MPESNGPPAATVAVTAGPRFATSLKSEQTGWDIRQDGPGSLTRRTLRIIGRLQAFVPAGSQYATWFQFPNAIHFRIVSGPKGAADLPNDLLSISGDPQTVDRYAARPSNQVVGENFGFDFLPRFASHFRRPGTYRVTAEWAGVRSEPFSIKLDP